MSRQSTHFADVGACVALSEVNAARYRMVSNDTRRYFEVICEIPSPCIQKSCRGCGNGRNECIADGQVVQQRKTKNSGEAREATERTFSLSSSASTNLQAQ